MRIAFFDDRFTEVYGAQENLLLLAKLSQEAGHQIELLTANEGLFAEQARSRGLDVTIVHAPERLRKFERELLASGVVQAIRSVGSLLRYSWQLHRHLRGTHCDLVVASAVRPTLMLSLTGLRRRPRLILWAQNSIPMGILATAAGMLSWRIALISPFSRTTFTKRTQRMLQRKFRPMASGRDFSPFTVDDSRPVEHTPTNIVTISSVTRRKGIDRLIDAIADTDLTDVKLTVVGGTTGPKSVDYKNELLDQAGQSGVSAEFVGWQDDVAPFLADADLFVLASEDEGLPGVLLEAMASGTACITTRAGGSGELIERCDAGIAVDVGDRVALSKAISELAHNADLRDRYARSGYDKVRLHYSLEASYQAFEAILAEADSR